MSIRILLCALCLCCFSCQESINEQQLQGVWELYYAPETSPKFNQFQINGDSIIYTDEHFFPFKSKVHLKRDQLKYEDLSQEAISIKILSINKDTLITADSLYYVKNSNLNDIYCYSLPGIRSDQILDTDSMYPFFHFFHLDGAPTLQIGNKYCQLKDLFQFTERIKRDTSFVLFLDKNVSLQSLETLYAYLSYLGWKNSKIVAGVNEDYKFELVDDTIEIWEEEIQKLMHTAHPPPLYPKETKFKSKLSYTQTNPTIIKINDSEDIQVIKNLSGKSNYLFSINKNLNLKEYLELKIKLNNFRTENRRSIIKCEIL